MGRNDVQQPEHAEENDTRLQPMAPARYKLILLSWAGTYVVITANLEVLGPWVAPWPLPLRTLLLSAVMVTAMTSAVTPVLVRLFRRWLFAHRA